MGLTPNHGRDTLVIDSEPYEVFEEGGRRRWTTEMVSSQPGDALARPYLLSAHGGFGATNRHTLSTGQPSDPTHHDYGENVDATKEAILQPSPRITYVDLSSKAQTSRPFRIGGYANSRVGGGSSGAPSGAIGGGSPSMVPQQFVEYGDVIYALCGPRTLAFDPDLATPIVVEGTFHGKAARARSGDLFNTRMVVALGDNTDAAIATAPYTSASPTAWSTATGVQMSVFRRGRAGKLFSSRTASDSGRVFSVLPGLDPATAANYTPSNGEKIVDPSDPVRNLTEFASALVAGTAKTARTLDPDRGYQGVSLITESRLSASEYDGRAMLAVGPYLFHGTAEAVYLLSLNAPPAQVGPEILERNESPFADGEPGIPDATGKFIAWPFYYPATGDSVIFLMRRRRPDEAGTGPYVWFDHLFLDGRECRAVYFWGGTASRGPRLFFGAGTSANPHQVGWVDWDESDAQPALSSTLYFPMDDFGHPGVTLECERLEIPYVENADATNYATWFVKARGGSDINLVKAQSGSNQERINTDGFAQVFAPNANIPSGRGLRFGVTFTQASGATDFVKLRGTPVAYIAAIPAQVPQHVVYLDVESQKHEDAQAIVDRLNALRGQKKQLEGEPGGDNPYIRIERVKTTEVEVRSGGGEKGDRRLVVELTFREVAVA